MLQCCGGSKYAHWQTRLGVVCDTLMASTPHGSNTNPLIIRRELPGDEDAVRRVHRAAFGTEAEANLVDALRAGGYVEAGLVAVFEEQLVGHILFSKIHIRTPSAVFDSLALAPVAVLPEFQRQGIGSELIERGLAECRDNAWPSMLVLGHPEFYPRFGFSAALARPLTSPFGGGEAWMAIELIPGALAGVEGQVEYSAPFLALGE